MLFSRHTEDPVTTIRYIFFGFFILLFITFFFGPGKARKLFALPVLIKMTFAIMLAYSAWSFVSLLFAPNVSIATYEVSRQLLNIILLFAIMVSVKKAPQQVLRLCRALVIVSLLQSITGLLQFYDADIFNIPATEKPSGLMVHRNLFGSAQVMMLAFVIYVWYKEDKIWKYASILAIAGIEASAIISSTRSAWLAGIAVLATSFILMMVYLPAKRKKWITSLLLCLASVVILVWILLKTNNKVEFSKSVHEKAVSLIRPSLDKSKSTGRFVLWDKTIRLIKDHPVLGVGPGNWSIAIWAYGTDNTSWGYGEQVPSRPHNVYLQVASETGLPGVILFISLWVLIGMMGFKTIKNSEQEDSRALSICMLSGLIAFATDNMFSFSMERIEHSMFVILMGGVITGLYANSVANKNETVQTINKKLLFTILYISAFNLFIGYKKYNFEKHMKLANIYRAQQLYEEVINEVEEGRSRFVTLQANGEPLEINAAIAHMELGNYSEALKEIKRAKNYNPNNARIYTTTGVVYTHLQQYGLAISAYKKAISLTPHYDLALANLARVYFATGNYKDCVSTIQQVSILSKSSLEDILKEAQKRMKYPSNNSTRKN
ncbi:MAG: O-antigen ligase family protein [Chitinophagaceae bacterium]